MGNWQKSEEEAGDRGQSNMDERTASANEQNEPGSYFHVFGERLVL